MKEIEKKMKRRSPIQICMVVEFTGDLIQIFVLNLSIAPPYCKGGCCRLIQVVKVLQFEMKFFLEKIYLLNSSGSDDPVLCRMIRPASKFSSALGRMIRSAWLFPSVLDRIIQP
jgi:hypothetical protein